ncbi:F-box domain-containing protein [Mycena kentingensis (nom. inval.)]|nr:F-box domain-containing protein [Mycena kentingensis (nom. inval.)]
MFFTDLHPDVLLSIFTCCSIRATLRLAQTCKLLRDLAGEKTLWLSLLGDLERRAILPSGTLRNHNESSTEELKAIAKRFTRRLPSWRGTSTPPDSVWMHKTLHENQARPVLAAKFVPGAALVLVQTAGQRESLECHPIDGSAMVWSRAIDAQRRLHDFAACVGDNGESVVVFSVSVGSDQASQSFFMEVHRCGLKTGSEVELFALQADNLGQINAPQISGNLCAAVRGSGNVASGGERWLLLNYIAGRGVTLRSKTRFYVQLVPGYVLALIVGTDADELRVFSTSTISTYLAEPNRNPQGAEEYFQPIELAEIPPDAVYTLHRDGAAGNEENDSKYVLSAFSHPFDMGTFRVWVYTSNTNRSAPPQLHQLDIRLDGAKPELVSQRWTSTLGRYAATPTSFAGYAISSTDILLGGRPSRTAFLLALPAYERDKLLLQPPRYTFTTFDGVVWAVLLAPDKYLDNEVLSPMYGTTLEVELAVYDSGVWLFHDGKKVEVVFLD